ncbi:uncharacterized protein GGS25DRAFT_17615 [Hypoxylon fragiforme]|uniref:uncharacterized protein n=1 Tax=Hypoxylon fragiforme TaxID=63214 RepID=UPI0020C6CCE5|nr:uncharacterized protein GGS25DRAFT_17615 [Hypoxylon fragiforme]KAI2613798.1 hypothetical protein GGS25DRAFT_17615 [Hypoxylon fragiforme]
MTSATPSENSKTSSFGSYARKLSITPKSSIHIHIKNHYRSKVYTTGSEVSGHVTINPPVDVRFDTLQVVLLGTSKTRLDAVNIPQSTAHTFLKLIMPIPESAYPIPRVFEAGMTYTVPFTFVIPSTLTLNACNHNVANDSVQEHHVRLPPSVGSWEKDDFSPNMSRVEYAVKARVYKDEEGVSLGTKLLEACQEIRVLPAVPEDAPLNITENDDLYKMSKRKTLRKTIISPKSGTVTITATQPSAAILSPDGQTITTTSVPLTLEFEPSATDVQPPKITGVSSKVAAVTFFSACGINHYPNLKDGRRKFSTDGRGSYSSTVSASTGSIEALRWGRHISMNARRDSGYGSEGLSSSDSDQTPKTAPMKKSKGSLPSPVYYTSRVQVPIQLPAHKKAFIPTFHSCITSRVYVLSLTVSVSSGGASAHITLNVPLQISVEATELHPNLSVLPPSFEEVEQADAADYLQPYSTNIPTIDFQAGSALPDYADIEFRQHRRPVAAH